MRNEPRRHTTARNSRLAAALVLAAALPVHAGEVGPLEELAYSPGLDAESMDPSVDPCEDFFRYACGGWLERNPIPPDRAAWDVYRKLADETLRYLWGLLQSASRPEARRDETRRLIGDHFAACMDTGRIEALGAEPVLAALRPIEALTSRDSLPGLLAELHATRGNGSAFFEFASLQDFSDRKRITAMFFAGGLGLPDREYYVSPELRMQQARERYVAHVSRMLQLLGRPAKRAASEASAVLRIETALATASLSRLERRDLENLHHPMTLKGLERRAPGFGWREYLALRGLRGLDGFNVTEPAFLEAVGRVIDSEPLENLRAYLTWSYLRVNANLLARSFRDERFDFYSRYLLGIEEQPPRWRTCVEAVDEDLGEALGRVFVAQTFTPATREGARQMIETIQSVMADRIRGLDWMSEDTKTEALRKLAAMRNKVGHPEKWREYTGLEIGREDHFGNRIRSAAFEDAKQLARIGRPPEEDDWPLTPQTVNAFYEPFRNEMVFSAAVLQPPLFDLRLDPAPAWGTTGTTIGHELVHGFDDRGRDVDADGRLAHWWTAQDERRFEERAQCIVDQYAQYTVVDGLRLNSRLTLSEDIADLAGTVLAYAGWKSLTAGARAIPRDGLTPAQRFFVGSAQWACGHETEARARARAVNGVHSPMRYRVNGVLVNMPEFAEAFGCKAGQPMVKEPPAVCRIW